MLGWGFMNFYYSSRILMFQLFDSLTQINQIKLEFTHLKDGIQRYLDYIHICLLTFCIIYNTPFVILTLTVIFPYINLMENEHKFGNT